MAKYKATILVPIGKPLSNEQIKEIERTEPISDAKLEQWEWFDDEGATPLLHSWKDPKGYDKKNGFFGYLYEGIPIRFIPVPSDKAGTANKWTFIDTNGQPYGEPATTMKEFFQILRKAKKTSTPILKEQQVSFDQLEIGKSYDRPYLAKLWGYKSYNAISRGVVTPAKTNFIILFVTKEKQEALTQYNDFIDGDRLHWEGEEKHSSDNRIINAASNDDQIHLFYRDIHHTPFEYYGQISLLQHNLKSDDPSEFVFALSSEDVQQNILDDIKTFEQESVHLENTEKETIVKSRIGQGLFRERLIKYWGSCAVTGIADTGLLKASHIKPWKNCDNDERIDVYNGLLLTPNYDHLFDQGYISFDSDGKIMISEKISEEECEVLGVDQNARISRIEKDHLKYLKFHQEKFGFSN